MGDVQELIMLQSKLNEVYRDKVMDRTTYVRTKDFVNRLRNLDQQLHDSKKFFSQPSTRRNDRQSRSTNSRTSVAATPGAYLAYNDLPAEY